MANNRQTPTPPDVPADYPQPRRRNPTPPGLTADRLTENQRRVLHILADSNGRIEYASIIEIYRHRGYSELEFLLHSGNGLQPRYMRSLTDSERAELSDLERVPVPPTMILTPDGYELIRPLYADKAETDE